MMKKAGFLLALICILSLTGCGMVASAEEEILQPDTEENTMSVNFDDVAKQSEPTEQFVIIWYSLQKVCSQMKKELNRRMQ